MFKKKERKIPEINTTALPDIIFMLLFFFMVVTVVKEPDSNDEIILPSVSYAESKPKEKSTLNIDVSIHEGKIFYAINNSKYEGLDNFEKQLVKLKELKRLQYDQKAILKVHEEILMDKVNALKTVLRELDILSIEYVINHKM